MALTNKSDSDLCKGPLISIITPVLNSGRLIEDHIRQVRAQTYSNIEHLIIDGGSSDGTTTILNQLKNEVDFWISEPDHGIYDAMNKGIDAANGSWLFFCGADDVFYDSDTLEQIFAQHKIAPDTQLICGKVVRSDGRVIKSRYNKLLYYKNTLPHQGVFYRNDIFDNYRYGGVKKNNRYCSYKISGDYHLNFYLFMRGAMHHFVDMTIMRCGRGRSMTGGVTGYREEIFIRHQFLGPVRSIIFDFATMLRFIRQRLYLNLISIW